MSDSEQDNKDNLNLFRVMLPWASNGNASDELGTSSSSVWAKNEDAAVLEVAEEMADSGEVEFSSAAERQNYIDSRCSGWRDVVDVKSSVSSELTEIFGDALYGNGSRVEINMDALRDLMVANKDLILKSPVRRPGA